MNEFRRLAAKIDQHMQQLVAQSVSEAHTVINRMMGYVPDLHRIWVGTSDQQLMALSSEFPGFYRYAIIMEKASEAERNKASRPYDGMTEFSWQYKQMGAQLLTTAATLERGYQAFRASGNLQVFRPRSTSWVACIGNGCPTWRPSRTRCARRAQNPRCWNT